MKGQLLFGLRREFGHDSRVLQFNFPELISKLMNLGMGLEKSD